MSAPVHPSRSTAATRRGWGQAILHGAPGLVLAGVLGVALAATSTALDGFPPARIHDELSYLLGADTFAHGRLTNPTHPMWRFFETFHVLQRPSYASKYPPAQSLMLALGQVLTGHPIVGVWLSFGLMCAALLWLLRAWVGPLWALAVTAASAVALMPTYWAHSFWGGAVAATGGALLYGAVRRTVASDRRSAGRPPRPDGARSAPGPLLAAVMALGVLILANSRPFEGALVCIPAAVSVAGWLLVAPAAARRARFVRFALPLAVVLAAGGSCMLAYNHAVTGEALVFPYVAYQRQYDREPLFRFQPKLTPPASPHREFRDFQAHEVKLLGRTNLRTFSSALRARAQSFGQFFFPLPLVCLAFVFLLAALDRWTLLALAGTGTLAVGIGLATWYNHHYVAPAAPLVLALWATGLRRAGRLRAWRVPIGLIAGMVALLAFAGGGIRQQVRDVQVRDRPLWHGGKDWARYRLQLIDSLAHSGGKHLVIVSYGPSHNTYAEWIYNRADIDAAPVVFARDLGDPANRPLLDHFPDRSIWRMRVVLDTGPFVLERLAGPRTRPRALEEP